MHVPVSRHHRDLRTRHHQLQDQTRVEDELRANRETSRQQQQLRQAKQFYAASRVGALVRGFLARVETRDRLRCWRAAQELQRVVRGWLGRLRWKHEYWKSVSVVRSRHALQQMLQRSRLVREEVRRRGGGSPGYRWKELFDPLSDSFWYYNAASGESSWECPLVLQSRLVCSWEGFVELGGLPSQGRCRCVFSSVGAYHSHMRREHRWYCVACSHVNSGAAFPTCALCGNQRGEGVGGVFSMAKAMQTSVAQARRRIDSFLAKDDARNKDFIRGYRISDRIVELALKYRDQVLRQAREAGEEEWDLHLALRFDEGVGGLAAEVSAGTPVLATPLRGKAYLNMCYAQRSLDPLTPLESLVTVPLSDIAEGVIPADAVEAVLNSDRVPERRLRQAEDFVESDYQQEILPNNGLFVCNGFMKGLCSLTTCPLAHPGVRDKAKVEYHAPKAEGLRRRPYVRVCQDALRGACKGEPLSCPRYHVYVRPSTVEIINRIYPVDTWDGTRVMPSKAVEYRGHITTSGFNGYGVMTWKGKAVYMGWWKENRRHGPGIYRTVDGLEYYGGWSQGLREGLGFFSVGNGDERYSLSVFGLY